MMVKRKKMPSTPFHVASVGDLVVDLVFTIPSLPIMPEQIQMAQGPHTEPGGAGNFLITGARLGLTMHALGSLGDDIYGHEVAQILAQEGVDTSGIVHAAGSTSTLVLVFVDEAGQHAFIGCYGEGPVLSFPDTWQTQIASADAFFTNAYSLCEPQLQAALPQAIETAHQAGIPIFLDVGPDISPVSDEMRHTVYKQSTVILGTEEEILTATGAQDMDAAASTLLQHETQIVVIKRGAQGCKVYAEQQVLTLDAFSVPLRDSTAAGDTFDAAFIYAYLHNYSLHDIATFANAVAAAKVQKVGSGRQVPTAQEVATLLQTHGVNLPFTTNDSN